MDGTWGDWISSLSLDGEIGWGDWISSLSSSRLIPQSAEPQYTGPSGVAALAHSTLAACTVHLCMHSQRP